jgi:hypothetical protein
MPIRNPSRFHRTANRYRCRPIPSPKRITASKRVFNRGARLLLQLPVRACWGHAGERSLGGVENYSPVFLIVFNNITPDGVFTGFVSTASGNSVITGQIKTAKRCKKFGRAKFWRPKMPCLVLRCPALSATHSLEKKPKPPLCGKLLPWSFVLTARSKPSSLAGSTRLTWAGSVVSTVETSSSSSTTSR